MNLMRYTVVDGAGRVSFLGSCSALDKLVAACAQNPGSLVDLLRIADALGAEIGPYVLSGLAVFDEHNLPGNYERIHAAIAHMPATELPVFRVVDEPTSAISLQPISAGAVLFNLPAKRIVQIQNTFREIGRSGIVRLRDAFGKQTKVHRYRLPAEWKLTP